MIALVVCIQRVRIDADPVRQLLENAVLAHAGYNFSDFPFRLHFEFVGSSSLDPGHVEALYTGLLQSRLIGLQKKQGRYA
jgi:hypothetical protein